MRPQPDRGRTATPSQGAKAFSSWRRCGLTQRSSASIVAGHGPWLFRRHAAAHCPARGALASALRWVLAPGSPTTSTELTSSRPRTLSRKAWYAAMMMSRCRSACSSPVDRQGRGDLLHRAHGQLCRPHGARRPRRHHRAGRGRPAWLAAAAPRQQVVNRCAHPDYRPALRDYLDRTTATGPGKDTPHLLGEALSWHVRYLHEGAMGPG
jgi:hypothetical protein